MSQLLDDRLTQNAITYLEDYCNALANTQPSTEEEIETVKKFEFGTSGYGQHPGIGLMPSTHPEYGDIIQGDLRYVAKCRYCSLDSPLVEQPAAVAESDVRHRHMNENFAEARIWLETKERDCADLFAPVVAYDDKKFRWLIMVEVDPEPMRSIYKCHLRPDQYSDVRDFLHLVENEGWHIHDIEIGWSEDRFVVLDYGEFWLTDNAWVIDEEDLM
jgi:hypothetical protein